MSIILEVPRPALLSAARARSVRPGRSARPSAVAPSRSRAAAVHRIATKVAGLTRSSGRGQRQIATPNASGYTETFARRGPAARSLGARLLRGFTALATFRSIHLETRDELEVEPRTV